MCPLVSSVEQRVLTKRVVSVFVLWALPRVSQEPRVFLWICKRRWEGGRVALLRGWTVRRPGQGHGARTSRVLLCHPTHRNHGVFLPRSLYLLCRPLQTPAHRTQAPKLWVLPPLRLASRLPILTLQLCLLRSRRSLLTPSDPTISLLFALHTCLMRLIPE